MLPITPATAKGATARELIILKFITYPPQDCFRSLREV
jgi:hypothetical protein